MKYTSHRKPATSSLKSNSRKLPRRDPRHTREQLSAEELGLYSFSTTVDPWRGQLVQLGWDYCV